MGTRFKGDNKDPAVNVTTWVLLVTIVFSVSARLLTKYRLFKKLTIDDLLITASLAFAVGQNIAVSLAVAAGYGQHMAKVAPEDWDKAMQALYAAYLLYIISLMFSKLSLAVFIRSLSPASKDKWLARGVEAIVYAWALAAFLGSAFQCSVPRTWDFSNGQCFNVLAWRYFVGISNIVTDLLIFSQAMVLMASIQTSLERRMIFAGIFVPRLFVVVATIVELTYVKKGTQTLDPSYKMCEMTILQVVIQCLGIVTACWGQLKPFLSWMRSNGFKIQGVEDPTAWSYKMSSRSQTRSKSRDRKANHFEAHESFPVPRRDQIMVTQDWEVDSQCSRAHINPETGPWNEEDGARSPDRLSK
ncbi:hypothetical protein N7492_009227 [Penicillium capsulatum]|uniref:Rhodopsin domain-containing protein n=1 Tax=Penicillium capsulatum TaxID=69766 RepID=A0A9W9HWR4_9EURO|nr:hypothetical protein N7492_009227 [Penicillium capsulatum]KAJ6106623.1 hypothetical protein N7512_010140 [Penicillium capsulatum]